MGQAFLASFLIGLREGLEVTLVVSILIAYLVKAGRRRELVPLWAGVVTALVAAVLFGALLTYTETTLLATSQSRELFDAISSVTAVVLVTWMIFWMRRTARRLKGELTGKLESAIGLGGWAIAGIAFVSVIREGLETALLFYTAAQGATSTATPLLAIAAGIATSVLIGIALYAGAIRVNLSKFFTVSGVLLIFVAAGIFKYGIHDFQESGVLAGGDHLAFDITNVLDPTSWYGAAISGMFNITGAPSVLETIAWVVYLVPVLAVFLWPTRTPAGSPRTVAASPSNPEATQHVAA
jgi:high-affinity iron transporter